MSSFFLFTEFEVYLYRKNVFIFYKEVDYIPIKVSTIIKTLFAHAICFLLLFPGVLGAVTPAYSSPTSEALLVSKVTRHIELPPNSDYIIRFDSQNLSLLPQELEPLTTGLSETVIAAIAKSPRWIQPRLASQFLNLDEQDSYAVVLLNASTQYADEIAFSIACCPIGRVPPAGLLKENVESLYTIDQWISYAEIVEYNDGMGNYSSTLRYRVLENGTETSVILPPEIYYWYVVHPKITNEEIDAVYGPLWRNYLTNHNDIGYPLLKEKLSAIQYLWDCQSYYQPGQRLWSVCINEHPTAIEAVSYWVGKTVPNQAIGDRPGQASVIAHEHNGWCGELQKIAVAGLRAMLVPSIAASNVGEDHVWREFYERGWHENDNWWSDTGGAVDEPDIYAYGWGKNMSAIYQWRGDGTIIQDTERYIHEEDRITVDFKVQDLFLQPVDGARVIVLVKGPKDITFYKNLFSEKLQSLWDKLPEILKGKLLALLFDKIEGRIDQIPDSITGFTITTWNYTDSRGQCSFELGKNLNYTFLIQEGNLKKPWQLARHNTFRTLNTGLDKSYTITFLDISQKPQLMTRADAPVGDCQFTLSIAADGYQLQKHFTNEGIGRYKPFTSIDGFIVDAQNLQRYKEGKSFTCYSYWNGNDMDQSVSTQEKDWFIILRNYNRNTHASIDFSITASVQTVQDIVQIVSPDTSVFEQPISTVGDTVCISGVATSDMVALSFDHEPTTVDCPVIDGEWLYAWNTSGAILGAHTITATSVSSDECTILLIDGTPPTLTIDAPLDGAILEGGFLNITGHSLDNVGIDRVEVTLNNETRIAFGTTTWSLSWDVTGLPLGDYTITVKAFDSQQLTCLQARSIVLNESGHSWGPQIHTIFYTPTDPTNTSNVILYANVTSTGPFSIQSIVLYCYDGNTTTSHQMYRYGQSPIQNRHEEDPLINQSNAPLFGVELGQFSSGQSIGFWIVATDTAFNRIQSEGDAFTIH